MKVGLVQYSQVWENREENINKINELLEKNLSDEELIIFPEMTLTGFTMQGEKFAEEIDGPGTRYFMDLAARKKKHILAGIIEKDGNEIYNSIIHFDDKGLIFSRYRKIHLFTLADEHNFYSDGNEKIVTNIKGIKTGLSICYDLRFPELYRHFAKNGAELIVDIASWPKKRIDHWKFLLKARAIENQSFVIGVNRVGKDAYLEYNGCSLIYNPNGDLIELVEDKECFISAELNFDEVKNIRKGLPFLQDIKLI